MRSLTLTVFFLMKKYTLKMRAVEHVAHVASHFGKNSKHQQFNKRSLKKISTGLDIIWRVLNILTLTFKCTFFKNRTHYINCNSQVGPAQYNALESLDDFLKVRTLGYATLLQSILT